MPPIPTRLVIRSNSERPCMLASGERTHTWLPAVPARTLPAAEQDTVARARRASAAASRAYNSILTDNPAASVTDYFSGVLRQESCARFVGAMGRLGTSVKSSKCLIAHHGVNSKRP